MSDKLPGEEAAANGLGASELVKSLEKQRWYHCTYASFVVAEHQPIYRPFSSRYGDVEGVPGTKMQHVHTDFPRAGTSGLPKSWSIDIERISILCDREVRGHALMARARIALSYNLHTALGPFPLREVADLELGEQVRPMIAENRPFWFDVHIPDAPYGEVVSPLDTCAPVDNGARLDQIYSRAIATLGDIPEMTEEEADAKYPGYAFNYRRSLRERRDLLKAHKPKMGQTLFWIFIEGWGQRVVV